MQVEKPRELSLIERFNAKVRKTETCWIWTGCTCRLGYGWFWDGLETVLAHRFAFDLYKGPAKVNLEIDHKCRNKRCVNPDHLQEVTHALNMQNLSGANRNSATGVRGVYWDRDRRKYRVRVRSGGNTHYGGRFGDLEEAEAAAIELRLKFQTNNLLDRGEGR